ncbi:helix-turn-helix domain-containing protein [Propionivibrio soli]|uniref:helix-turn-helix domain-containing protein n=1 Tax=Propionivibrio soli TaxID=2976531 RepID=UPI0021E932EC|nr:AraC family transcriptional regulator [Propionivibrio soli]
MGESFSRKPSLEALKRSEVRRWRLPTLEHVRHRHPGQEWIPHWHSEWSFGAIVRGACLCSIDGKPAKAVAGDVLAISPHTVHTGALADIDGSESVSVVMLYVATEWLEEKALVPPRGSGFVSQPESARAASNLHSPEQIEQWLRALLPWLCDALPIQSSNPTASARQTLKAFEQGVLEGELSIHALAERCRISRERLHRVISRWTGMNPSEYLRALRVNRARELLLDGEPLSAIAAASGFADQAHFTRAFRQSFGYTPGDLQAALRKRADADGQPAVA